MDKIGLLKYDEYIGGIHMGKRKFSLFRWRHMPIGQKYVMVFILSAVLFMTAGTLVYQQFQRTQASMDDYIEQTETVQDLTELAIVMQNKDLQLADYIITKNSRHIERYEESIEDSEKIFANLKETIGTTNAEALNFIMEENEKFDVLFNDMVRDIDLDLSEEYIAATRSDSDGLRSTIVEAIDRLIANIDETQESNLENSQKNMQFSLNLLAVANLSAIAVGIIVLLLVSRNISNHLKRVINVTTEMINGNFGVEPIDYEGRDEIAQLANSVNNMRESFRNILINMDETSNRLNDSSNHLATSANEVQQSSEQIAISMSELATGTETQANSTADLLTHMNNFVNIVQTSEKESEQMAEESTEVLSLTEEGAGLMSSSVQQMNQIDKIVKQTVEQVQGLDKQSAQISNLVLVVKDIAEQTNLLALNAAIEAARAGEYGSGFSVVAEEVRTLAEQVTDSVSEITTIVNEIQAETGQVVQALTKGYEEVQEGTVQIEQTGESFTHINEAIENMTERIKSISNNMENIVTNSDHMNNLIEDISAVSQESAANVEEAAATSEETSSVMEGVAQNADELNELADELKRELEIFKI